MNFGIPKWNSNDDDDGYKGVNDIRNGYQNTMTTNNHAIIWIGMIVYSCSLALPEGTKATCHEREENDDDEAKVITKAWRV